ncbi:hypothetical protein [Streptomyces odontomachi]|uniref:hypothetical protein n=1 Tax=Streptomyces odontomachi TaxID=2944940 RepID=UPI00210A5FEE|nr:hypothetical protein [Streptomyces sp. ODS25]
MRRTVTAAALALTALSLVACGGKGDEVVTHKVTLEVLGKGTTEIYYTLDTNRSAKVTLPWKKTATITLTTAAEKRIGRAVGVVPGSVYRTDGTLKAASCAIIVDGKKVMDNQGGKADGSCKYTVK